MSTKLEKQERLRSIIHKCDYLEQEYQRLRGEAHLLLMMLEFEDYG